MYPKLVIDKQKLQENTANIAKTCKDHGINIMSVTKSFCAIPEVADAIVKGGTDMLADSRVQNLKKLSVFNVPRVLLRLPMAHEVEEVVKYADISFNSELSTIKALNEAAKAQGKKHSIVLMFDLGDLREGILPEQMPTHVEEILSLENIVLYGVGVNLTCYGGVIPDENNLGELAAIADRIRNEYKVDLKMVTGGNSSSYYLLGEKRMPKGITNLRPGELLVLGRETAYGNIVEGLHTDVFTLNAQIIELKTKDSLPKGNIGMDAFGNKPVFTDKGKMVRAIVGIGRQDVNPSGLTPYDDKIEIIGASSDHMIIDITHSGQEYKVGDILTFNVDYGALLQLTTSEYVEKEAK